MKYLFLIWNGLWRRPMRTSLTLISAIIAFLLFGILTGIDSGIRHMVDLAHIDRLISGNPGLLPMPLSYVPQVEKLSGVATVTYANAMAGTYKMPANRLFVYAIDADRYFSIYPETVASVSDRQTMRHTVMGALASLSAARRFGWKRGDRISFRNPSLFRRDGSTDWPVEIVGFCNYTASPDTPLLLINYSYLDAARIADKGTVQRLVVKLRNPDQAGVVSGAIDAMFANGPVPLRTQTEKEFAEAQLSQIGNVAFFVDAVIGAVFFTLLLMLGNTLMQSFRERVRDFAVLKTLGFSDMRVTMIVASEAILLCGIAGIIGLVLARIGLLLLGRVSGGLVSGNFSASVFGATILFVLLAALTSVTVPMWRSHRLSIVEGLASH
jgi:putative ABC transport system permease protein